MERKLTTIVAMDVVGYEGRLDEAIETFDTAIRPSPLDPFRWAFYSCRALAHLFRGEFEEAVAWARRSLRSRPHRTGPGRFPWRPSATCPTPFGRGRQGDALLPVKPAFSIDFAREHLFNLKRNDQMELYLYGLRKAGVA